MHEPLDRLYQDPVGALVQDLCSRIFWPTVSGSCRRTCARSLYQDPVGQLVQDLCVYDPLDHLHQDPVGALVQDLCRKIFWPTVSGSSRRTCARSLYQDRGTTCARSLFQDLCVSILWTTCIRILH